MNIDALTAYLALSSGSYSGILRDMYAVHNLGLNPDLHTKLLANRFVGGTKELSGTPPLSFKSKGKPLTAWSITGNTVQNGTPTPENPVEVAGVGDRTGNLFDYKKYFESTFTKYSEYFEWAEIQLKPFTTYTFTTSFSESAIVTNVINTAFIITTSTEEPKTLTGGISSTRIATKTTEADGIIKIYKRIRGLFLPKKEHFDSGMHWLMINEGDTALSYEPYGYKIPVVTRGKNLFDKTAVRYEVAIGGSNPAFVDYPGSAIFIIPAIKGIKNYTLKVKSDVDISIIRLAFYDKPIPVSGEYVNNMKQISNSKNPIVTSSNENNLPYIVVQVSGAFVDSYGLDTIQLEVGNIATPYEPYHEPITTPIYLPTPLYSGEVLRSDGSREVKWGKITFDGSSDENWDILTRGYRIYVKDAQSVPQNQITNSLCSHFVASTYPGVVTNGVVAFSQRLSTNGKSNGFAFSIGEEANNLNIENWRKRLSESPVTVWYRLATPTTETFTAPQIPTLNGTTVIDVDTAVKPEIMTIKYRR